jgi:hypothetical protein
VEDFEAGKLDAFYFQKKVKGKISLILGQATPYDSYSQNMTPN